MIIKLLVGRVLPLGAAAMLLKSSYSPIQPALAAFGAATNALSGDASDDSGAHFDQLAQDAQGQIAAAQGGGIKGALENLFGHSSHPDQAKKELDAIIEHVKGGGRGPDDSPSPADHPQPGQAAQPAGNRKGSKSGGKKK